MLIQVILQQNGRILIKIQVFVRIQNEVPSFRSNIDSDTHLFKFFLFKYFI